METYLFIHYHNFFLDNVGWNSSSQRCEELSQSRCYALNAICPVEGKTVNSNLTQAESKGLEFIVVNGCAACDERDIYVHDRNLRSISDR